MRAPITVHDHRCYEPEGVLTTCFVTTSLLKRAKWRTA